jgi:hypothetical protein
MSFAEILQTRYLTYLLWRRDAFIIRCQQTEKGREYLENARRMEQTKPDRIGLRKKLHGGE